MILSFSRKTLFPILVFATLNLYSGYDENQGRLLDRSSLGGGNEVNLYGFVKNDPVNNWDYLGLWLGPTHRSITDSAWTASGIPLKYKKHWGIDTEKIIKEIINANLSVDSNRQYFSNSTLTE
jgi:hypothetical protein